MKQHPDNLATNVDCRLRLLLEELSSSGCAVILYLCLRSEHVMESFEFRKMRFFGLNTS